MLFWEKYESIYFENNVSKPHLPMENSQTQNFIYNTAFFSLTQTQEERETSTNILNNTKEWFLLSEKG